MIDDLGRRVHLPRESRRVVSLVPSLTEALASVYPERIVAATQYCTQPAGLAAVRVRGTKNPDLAAIAAVEPDVVVCNQEENRSLDVERLRQRGIAVWVTRIDSLDDAFQSLSRLYDALGWAAPAWLGEARAEWREPSPPRGTVAALIWRDPWMAIGQGTFASDVLHHLGLRNEVSGARYPTISPRDVVADVVALTSEPYPFSAHDGPELFPGANVRLVDGRLLEWYGPSLMGARRSLESQLLG